MIRTQAASSKTNGAAKRPINGAAAKPTTKARAEQIHVPPQRKNKLEEAMDNLRQASDMAMDALGLKPLSPVRKFINFVCATAAAGGAYYIVMSLTELMVVAAATYIGISF